MRAVAFRSRGTHETQRLWLPVSITPRALKAAAATQLGVDYDPAANSLLLYHEGDDIPIKQAPFLERILTDAALELRPCAVPEDTLALYTLITVHVFDGPAHRRSFEWATGSAVVEEIVAELLREEVVPPLPYRFYSVQDGAFLAELQPSQRLFADTSRQSSIALYLYGVVVPDAPLAPVQFERKTPLDATIPVGTPPLLALVEGEKWSTIRARLLPFLPEAERPSFCMRRSLRKEWPTDSKDVFQLLCDGWTLSVLLPPENEAALWPSQGGFLRCFWLRWLRRGPKAI
jgi:hypothetical protein